MSFRISYKVVLLGELGVGKSAIFSRLRGENFDPHQALTSSIDLYSPTFMIGNDEVALDLWDTAGAERYRTLTKNYYRAARAVVFVYSNNDISSLDYLDHWVVDSLKYQMDAVFILMGTKSDMPQKVSQESITAAAEQYGMKKIYHVSAKTNHGIQEAFQEIAEMLHLEPTPKTCTMRAPYENNTGLREEKPNGISISLKEYNNNSTVSNTPSRCCS